MKFGKFVVALTVLMLMVGCFAPVALAKPKTDYVSAVGKGLVTYNGVDVKADIALKGFVTPGGYTVEADGVACVVLKFVLPDGTKISAVRDVPFKVLVDDENVLQGFKLIFDDETVNIQTTTIKNKIIGYTVGEKLTIQTPNADATLTLNFIFKFKVEIEGIEAGH